MEKFGLLTFVLIVALGIFSRQYVAKKTHLPYTVVMMCFGGIVGAVLERESQHVDTPRLESPTIRAWYNMSPEVMLYSMIPLLVFESAFMIDTHIFGRIKWQVMTMAGPGVLVASILTATFLRFGMPSYHWDFVTCLMVGAILSATDPVAVVALLKELGVSERLGTLIEGESLINDGTAIVIFDVFKHALEHAPCSPSMPKTSFILYMLIRLAFLGPIVGTCVGAACTTMLGLVLNDPFNEIAITILACYAAFGIAEGVVGTSGVLSVVTCGMYLSRYGRGRISASVEHSMHSFWSTIVHVANTAVFFLAGLIIAVRVFSFRGNSFGTSCLKCSSHDDDDHHHHTRARRQLSSTGASKETSCISFSGTDFWYLLQLYIVIHLIRMTVIALASPVLKRGAYGFGFEEAAVVSYGGLRGAIGLALALIVMDIDGVEDILKMRVLFQVSGIVVLTLCVNGTTTRHLLHFLGLDKNSEAQNEIFAHVTLDVERKLEKEISLLKREQFLGDADWQMVWRYLPILSVECYWLRIHDGRIVLSEAELEDLRDLSNLRKKTKFLSWRWGSRKSQYPIPPLLRSRWLAYHRQYGLQPPRFLHSADATSDPTSQDYESIQYTSFDDILRAVNECAIVDDVSRVEQRNSHRRECTLDLVPCAENDGDDEVEVKPVSAPRSSIRRLIDDLSEKTSTSTTVKRPLRPSSASFHRPSLSNINEALPHARPRRPSQLALGGASAPRDSSRASLWFSHHRPSAMPRRSAMSPANVPPKENMQRRSTVVIDAVARFFGVTTHENNRTSMKGRKKSAVERKMPSIASANEAVFTEARARTLWAVKANYHAAFSRGRLSSKALRVLHENADLQSDNADTPLNEWEQLTRTDLRRVVTLRRLTALKAYIPFASGFLDYILFVYTAFLLETGYNFVHAHEDVDVNELVDDGPVKRDLVKEILHQRKLAKEAIAEYMSIFPSVANAVKTRVAARYVLVTHHSLMEELHHHGHITEKELDESAHCINSARLKLARHPYIETMPPLAQVLADQRQAGVPFLDALTDDDLQYLLADPSRCHSEIVSAGITLAKYGRRKIETRASDHLGRRGWFLIARGSVSINASSQECSKPIIPIDPDEAILSAGSACCIEEQLLGIPFPASYRTLSMCHVIFFDLKAMLQIASRCAPARRSMWWMVALRVLRESSQFASISSQSIRRLGLDAKFLEVKAGPESFDQVEEDLASGAYTHSSRRGRLVKLAEDARRSLGNSAKKFRATKTKPFAPTNAASSTLSSSKGVTDDEANDEAHDNFPDDGNCSPFCLDTSTGTERDQIAVRSESIESVSDDTGNKLQRGFIVRNSSKAILDTSPCHEIEGGSSPNKAKMYWAKARIAVAVMAEFKQHAKLHGGIKYEKYNVPRRHCILLLKGTALLPSPTETNPENCRVVHSISMIHIDHSINSRTVHLSPGSKAFLLSEFLLDIASNDKRASVSTLACSNSTTRPLKALNSVHSVDSESWLSDNLRSRRMRLREQLFQASSSPVRRSLDDLPSKTSHSDALAILTETVGSNVSSRITSNDPSTCSSSSTFDVRNLPPSPAAISTVAEEDDVINCETIEDDSNGIIQP